MKPHKFRPRIRGAHPKRAMTLVQCRNVIFAVAIRFARDGHWHNADMLMIRCERFYTDFTPKQMATLRRVVQESVYRPFEPHMLQAYRRIMGGG